MPLGRHSGAFSSRLDGIQKKEDNTMEPMKQNTPQNKGGRPKKAVKKNQLITLKCTSYEKMQIRAKAKKTGLSTSEYLLQLGLNGKIDSTIKTLPKEVLHVTGTLNHMAANLNQLAKKHNSVTDILTPLDRAGLQLLSGELKGLAVTIKNYLK